MAVLTSDGDIWGGKIYARPGSDTDTDRTTVEDAGFTILGQDDSAGSAVLWVYGTNTEVGAYVNDILGKLRLPGWFFRLATGEEVTLVRIKQWDQYRRLVY